jgi:hypothetical protein
LTPMKVDSERVSKTPVKKGRIATMWYGSPMHVDGEGVGVAKERKRFKKSFPSL